MKEISALQLYLHILHRLRHMALLSTSQLLLHLVAEWCILSPWGPSSQYTIGQLVCYDSLNAEVLHGMFYPNRKTNHRKEMQRNKSNRQGGKYGHCATPPPLNNTDFFFKALDILNLNLNVNIGNVGIPLKYMGQISHKKLIG